MGVVIFIGRVATFAVNIAGMVKLNRLPTFNSMAVRALALIVLYSPGISYVTSQAVIKPGVVKRCFLPAVGAGVTVSTRVGKRVVCDLII